MELTNKIKVLIENFLMPYLSTLHSYAVYIENENAIIVTGNRDEEDSGFYLLRLMVQIENEELLIPTIFIPFEDRKQGIGMQLLNFIFQISKNLGFGMALVQMVDSFRDFMLSRGAVETQIYDCLQITEDTILVK